VRVTAETKNATRQRILDVGKTLFAQQGFEATTTRDIAQASQIAVGTLFNYFPTKESIVECLVSEAWGLALAEFAELPVGADSRTADDSLTLEEALFSQAAGILRRLRPYRKYLPAVLETSLSPLADTDGSRKGRPLRAAHLENVSQIIAAHGQQGTLSSVALQLYWTLLTGVLAFWSSDRSPRQEDTLALLDESLAMFVGWLTVRPDDSSNHPQSKGR
jgi:AcrR family transcriptional regulator